MCDTRISDAVPEPRDKALPRIVDYVKCFVAKVEPGMIYDLNKTVGLKVGGYCRYDPGQGWNQIQDWRPASKAAAATATGKEKGQK